MMKNLDQRPSIALAVALAAAICGCGGGEHREAALPQLDGTIVSDRPLIVLPNEAWQRHADEPWWVLGRTAALGAP